MSSQWTTRGLKRNHGCEQPSRVIYLDCETVPVTSTKGLGHEEHKYRLSVTRYTRRDRGRFRVVEDRVWTCRQRQWDYIESLCTSRGVTWVIAHNAVFDLTVSDFWSRLDGGEYILSGHISYHTGRVADINPDVAPWTGLMAVDDRKCIIECCTRKGRLNVVDSMNYFRCSLASLGDSIGLHKMQMPAFEDDDERWIEYCTNDVRVLSQAMMGLMRRWSDDNIGNWQPTAASLAWSNYRHKHLDECITTHNCEIASALERRSHIGGECRAFYVGDILDKYSHDVWDWNGRIDNGRAKELGPVSLYDVRSLYPYVMSSCPMPVRLVHVQSVCHVETISEAVDSHWCVADVTIKTNEPSYPYRCRVDGRPSWHTRTIYPIGTFRTTLCGGELRRAVSSGSVIGVGSMAMYETALIFSSHVDYWYSRKIKADREGESVERELCKIMLNSLYGRFAMGNKQWKLDPTSECDLKWGAWTRHNTATKLISNYRGVAGNVLKEVECVAGEHQLCAIASAITEAGRSHMRAIRSAMPAKTVLYQDTDSLMIFSHAKHRLAAICDLESDNIGSMKLKGEYDSTEIYGVKNYSCDGINTISGLPRTANHMSGRTWDATLFESASEILSRQMPDSVLTTHQIMDFSRPITPDMPTASGWTVPVMVDDLQLRSHARSG